jgi:hypothetical protein
MIEEESALLYLINGREKELLGEQATSVSVFS